MIIVGKYVGTAGLSAVSQSSLILNFATMVCLGFSNGGQVLVAQTLGAGKHKEMNDIINKISQGIQYAAILTVVFMIVYITCGKWLFMMFSDAPLVHEMSGTFIKAILWMFPAMAIMRGSNAFVQGIGNEN